MKEYDSIEGVTYWTHTPVIVKELEPFSVRKPPRLIIMRITGSCNGQARSPCENPDWSLLFRVKAETAGEDPPLTLRLGDRRIRPEPKSYETGTDPNTGEYEERITFPLDTQDVRDLAELPKGKVEGRLDGTNMNLSYERRKAIRLLHEKFTADE